MRSPSTSLPQAREDDYVSPLPSYGIAGSAEFQQPLLHVGGTRPHPSHPGLLLLQAPSPLSHLLTNDRAEGDDTVANGEENLDSEGGLVEIVWVHGPRALTVVVL